MSRETKTISRREMLKRSAALSALASAQVAWPGWMPRLAFARNAAPKGDVLVVVFLRGGADGLNVVVPHGEKAYYAARPTLNVARPDDKNAEQTNRAVDLDGFFGLHPALGPLHPIFKGGQMLAVHSAGSPDPTRSHFDAMDFMERGTPGSSKLTTGWLGRHLAATDNGSEAPLRAIGWGTALQTSLRGTISATAIQSIVNYHLNGRQEAAAQMLAALNAMYSVQPDALKAAADQTNVVLDLVSKINVASYKAANGAAYDDKNEFDMALMQTAALIKAEVGLEVSAIDVGGWDTHQNEISDLTNELTILGKGLAAFHQDMGDLMKKVALVVMSEFGRRVQENASGGTDHGHGNMMMVMGGNVAKSPVIAKWPGLEDDQLDRGDLAITIDYRDVLAEILTTRVGNPALEAVFPDFKPTPRGIVTK